MAYVNKSDIYKLFDESNGVIRLHIADVDMLPTADVVEVVRCKDCDVPHNKWLGCPNLNGLIPPPDFYCAKGTPKERGKRK